MTISSTYARFTCRICGETVYSPVLAEMPEGGFPKNRTLELSCSSGHTDQYNADDIVFVPKRLDGGLRMRHAFAAGG